MKIFKIVILSFLALATSCGSVKQIDTPVELQKRVSVPESWAVLVSSYEDVSGLWLETFKDPVMLALIDEGQSNNLDLQRVASNMTKAWLLAEKSGASLKPSSDLSLGAKQNEGPDAGSINIGLTVSWELDLWGRLGAGIAAAEASAQAAEADYIAAQHSLSASIAKTYLKVIETKRQAEITNENLLILQKTLRITQVKYDNGLSSGQDVALNRANLAAAQDQLLNLDNAKREALRSLEVLLGRYPNAALEIPSELPSLPPQPPAGIPSEILERRPDIVAAERQVAAAFNLREQVKAARLPRLSLTSNLSGASKSLSEVLNPANLVWQLGSNLIVPLLDGGKRKIDIRLASVDQREAISNYANKALAAFSEVESNLSLGLTLANRIEALSEVLLQSKKAYYIADIRYREGEIGLLDTLTLQKQAVAAESNLLSVRRAQLEQRINLYLSLGGNW